MFIPTGKTAHTESNGVLLYHSFEIMHLFILIENDEIHLLLGLNSVTTHHTSPCE